MIATIATSPPRLYAGVFRAICLSDVDTRLLQGPLTPARQALEAVLGSIARVSPEQWDALLARWALR